jgi:hypothetical protein
VNPGSRIPWLLLGGAACAIGVALRSFELSEQIVLEDELVSVQALRVSSYEGIASRFDHAYYSIPHTLLLKAIAEWVGLDELTLRLPSLLAGLALLFGGPWLVWRRFGADLAAIFALLLAFSPLLVFYSRIARSYGIAITLVFFALLALERWLEEQRPRDALTYVLCAVAAIWFHQLTAPALLAPLATGALFAALAARPGRRLAHLGAPLLLGAALLVLSAALLWNPLFASGGLLTGKLDRVEIPWSTLREAAALFAGTRTPWLVALFWIAVALGCGLALRRQPLVSALLLTSAVAQWASLLILGPWLAEVPRIFARYVVWSLPGVLLCLALALAQLGRLRVAGRGWPAPLLASVLLAATLHLHGPLPATLDSPNNFTTHPDFQESDFQRLPWEPAPAPLAGSDFYRRLREEPGDFAIVEAPWHNSRRMVPYHRYQAIHRKPVRIGFLAKLSPVPNPDEFPLDAPGLEFRLFVDVSDPAALRAAGVRYLVLHRNLGVELGFPALSSDLGAAIAALAQRVGPPVFEDDRVAVFALR